MNVHEQQYLNAGDVVIVDFDTQCNVMVMDDINFRNFKSGRKFEYHGGFYDKRPAQIKVPRTGNWNIYIDGWGTGQLKYEISYIK
jgi:hypothetical protein